MQGGPAQPVDVVDLDTGPDQPADDAGMPPLAGADQAGPLKLSLLATSPPWARVRFSRSR